MDAPAPKSASVRRSADRRAEWDRRYASADLVWGAGPNRFVAEAFADVEPAGAALDLACGEGRNAIWLAERGWDVTGVDFSGVAIERARGLAAQRGVRVRFEEADVAVWTPQDGHYALVVVSYLQLPGDAMARIWRGAAAALAPGGQLFAIGHAARNLAEGFGGPPDARVLWDADAIRAELEAAGLRVEVAEEVLREVADAPRPAIDARVRAHRDA